MNHNEAIGFDAAVVLGAGIDSMGKLGAESIQRAGIGAILLTNNQANHIIMAGAWSLKQSPPPRTEAAAMKTYVEDSFNLPPEAITAVGGGYETIGNAIFVKTEVLIPRGWSRVMVVTTNSHLPRSLAVFRHVFGSEYTVEGYGSGPYLSRRSQYVQELLGGMLVRQVFKGTQPGDHEAVRDRLYSLVPGYTDLLTPTEIWRNLALSILGRPLRRPEAN